MNKLLIQILLTLIMTNPILGQKIDCSKYYADYFESKNSDSVQLPNYTAGYVLFESKKDSIRQSISGCISDFDEFCAGVEEALESESLSIRQVGDPWHVSACSYYSYENYGVNLVMTGDIIYDEGIFDKNAGFNFIMRQRIIDRLGIHVYHSLGETDSSWIEIDEILLNDLIETFNVVSKSDSTIYLKIDNRLLSNTEFNNLNGVIFKDAMTKKSYSYQEALEGIKINCLGDSKRGFLSLDFSEYLNPKFCTSTFGSVWTIPIKLNE